MGLQADEAVHDVDTRTLERLRPRDVGGLVETRLQFDQGGHLHTPFGRADEAPSDRAVATRAVERDLDRLDAGVVGGLGDERLDRGGEALVGVVHQERPFTHDREDRPIRLVGGGETARGDRRPQVVLQVGPVDRVQLHQAGEIEESTVVTDVDRVEVELPQQQFEHLGVDVLVDLETGRRVRTGGAAVPSRPRRAGRRPPPPRG